MSIRYTSGGHSFSAAELAALGAAAGVEVYILTSKVTLIPVECYDNTRGADYLASLGLAPAVDEIVVESIVKDGMVAVMAVDKIFVETLRNANVDVVFHTPLLDEAVERGTIIELCGDVAFIRVSRDGLRFAEAVEVKSDADLIYVAERLNQCYDIYNMYARAKGDVERVCRILKGCFKNLTK